MNTPNLRLQLFTHARALWLAVVSLFGLTACQTTDLATVVTPERVRAVAAVGAYYGAKAALAEGHRPEVEQGLAALKALAAAPEPDISAVIAALDAAQLTLAPGEEGRFLVSMGVIFFDDLWQQSGQVALKDPQVRAFLEGVIHGATLALEAPAARAPADPTGARLKAEARATR